MITFIFPSVNRITSAFRTKLRPNHHGVDFAEKGVHFIKAVADGIVTRSDYSKSYGEVVYIQHHINGQVWESVYGHMQKNSRKVKLNQKVEQGQEIGIMGNTGDSNGQHLHFELHKGKWNMDKSNAVDPLLYLGKDLNPVSGAGKYIIKKGDTLSQLANKYKTTVPELMKLNPSIKNKDVIHQKQVIKVPTGKGVYVVKKGDHLTGISQKYNTSVEQLLSMNPDIKNKDIIRVGQVINVPK